MPALQRLSAPPTSRPIPFAFPKNTDHSLLNNIQHQGPVTPLAKKVVRLFVPKYEPTCRLTLHDESRNDERKSFAEKVWRTCDDELAGVGNGETPNLRVVALELEDVFKLVAVPILDHAVFPRRESVMRSRDKRHRNLGSSAAVKTEGEGLALPHCRCGRGATCGSHQNPSLQRPN